LNTAKTHINRQGLGFMVNLERETGGLTVGKSIVTGSKQKQH
jgi:hypothetical protein